MLNMITNIANTISNIFAAFSLLIMPPENFIKSLVKLLFFRFSTKGFVGVESVSKTIFIATYYYKSEE